MNYQKAGLIVFLGTYLTNTVVAALIALVPASEVPGVFTPQYLSFVGLSAVVVGLLAWWAGVRGLVPGVIFGALGFVVALLVSFITGISGVLAQTGSLGQMFAVIPNFGPFIFSMTTVWLLGYWMIPSILVGWLRARGMSSAASPVSSVSM